MSWYVLFVPVRNDNDPQLTFFLIVDDKLHLKQDESNTFHMRLWNTLGFWSTHIGDDCPDPHFGDPPFFLQLSSWLRFAFMMVFVGDSQNLNKSVLSADK